MIETWDLEGFVAPCDSTSFSIRRVETPSGQQIATEVSARRAILVAVPLDDGIRPTEQSLR